jgi:chromosome segregation ATPase
MTDLKTVESEMTKLDQAKDSALPRLGKLREKRQALQGKLADALVQTAMGRSTNGAIDKLRGEIRAVDTEISEVETLAEGLRQAEAELHLQREAIRLGLDTAEFAALIPRLEKDRAKYVALRAELLNLANKLEKDHSRAAGLRAKIQERRLSLHVGQADCGDLPGIPAVKWTDTRFSISPDQLRGVKPW